MTDTKRRVLVLTRHGHAPKAEGVSNDDRVLENVGEIYENVGEPLQRVVQAVPHTSFLRHSGISRAEHTGQTILVGALGLKPSEGQNPPESVADLANYDISVVDSVSEVHLGYSKLDLNMDLFHRVGGDGYLIRWAGNPDATELDGGKVTPFNELMIRVGPIFYPAVRRVARGEDDLGVIASHGCVIEPVAMLSTPAGRNASEYLDAIGGPFGEGDNVQLYVDETRGGSIEAGLYRDGNKLFDVDLEKVLR